MATLIIPAPESGYPDQTFKVPINGITYTMRWTWADAAGSWFFAISDAAGPILAGVRVANNVDLLKNTADPRKPDGALMPIAPDRDESDPGMLDLGPRVQLVFIDTADLGQ